MTRPEPGPPPRAKAPPPPPRRASPRPARQAQLFRRTGVPGCDRMLALIECAVRLASTSRIHMMLRTWRRIAVTWHAMPKSRLVRFCRQLGRYWRRVVRRNPIVRQCAAGGAVATRPVPAVITAPAKVLALPACRALLKATRCYLGTLKRGDAKAVREGWRALIAQWKGQPSSALDKACRATAARWRRSLIDDPRGQGCFRI